MVMAGAVPQAYLLCGGSSQVELRTQSTLTSHERHKMENHGLLRDGSAGKGPELDSHLPRGKACHGDACL